MCKYCENDSYECCIFQDPLDKEWYLELQTSEWDHYNDDFVRLHEYINYCPYCGEKLGAKNETK